jgi:sulfite exporter TauE/SafE
MRCKVVSRLSAAYRGVHMARTLWSLFITGLFLGYGPCLLSCGPLLVSYIAATKKSGASGLKTYLIFSVTRLFVYVLFGVLAGAFGERVIPRVIESDVLRILFFLFGLFLLALGWTLIFERLRLSRFCEGGTPRRFKPQDTGNVIFMGLVVAMSPCLPLLAILGYIALISDTCLKGAAYMTSFGLGTLISPMILLSFSAGWVAQRVKQHPEILRRIRMICGGVIVFLGVHLMILSFIP